MWRRNRCGIATVGGAFGLGMLLMLTCSLRLALVLAAILLVVLCWSVVRW